MRLRLFTRLFASLGVSRLRKRLLGSFVTHVLAATAQGRFLIPVDDFVVGKELAFKGAYQSADLDRILHLVDGNARVLFVGSHIGAYVVPVASRVATVVAIEANPDTFETLSLNVALNRLSNVQLIQGAAYDQEGWLPFVKSTHNSGGSKLLPPGRQLEFFYDSPETVQVRTAPVDHWIALFRPTHVIMDLEGAEYHALAGMTRTLQICQTLVIEFVPNHVRNIARVSPEEFFQRIPSEFAMVATLENGEFQTRDKLLNIVQEVEAKRFYKGVDLVFAKETTREEHLGATSFPVHQYQSQNENSG